MARPYRAFPPLAGGDARWVASNPAGAILRAGFFEAAEEEGGGGGGSIPTPLVFGSYQWVAGVGGPTYTCTGLAIGPADSERWVIAAVFSNFKWDGTVSSVTIGGVAATSLYGAPVLTGGGGHWEFWTAKVPTGTTADVVVTTEDAAFWDGAGATYYCIGEPTFVDGAQDGTYTGNTFSVAVDVAEGGAIIAIASNDNAGVLSGWVGVAADSTDNTEQVYYASADELDEETGRAVSFTTTEASSSTNFYGLGVVSVAIPFSGGGGDEVLYPEILINSKIFGLPSVGRGPVDLQPPLIFNTQTFGAPTVSRGVMELRPPLTASSNTFHGVIIQPGPVDLRPENMTQTNTFGSPTVSRGAVILAPEHLIDPNSFGSPQVSPREREIHPELFENESTFGTPVVSTGVFNVAPKLLINTSTFGQPEVVGGGSQVLRPDHFISTASFGQPSVTTGGVELRPSVVQSATAFGSPSMSTEAVEVAPLLLPSITSFGVPVIEVGPAFLAPEPLLNQSSFGQPEVVTGAPDVRPVRFVNQSWFGSPRVRHDQQPGPGAYPGRSSNGGMLSPSLSGGVVLRPWNGGFIRSGE